AIPSSFDDYEMRIPLLVLAVVVAACTEPRSTPRPAATPAAALEAHLELSSSTPRAGDSLTVRVRLNGAASSRIASCTGRLTYDSTSLRYVADGPIADGATRVSNPTPGLIRSAAVNANGFADGLLVEYRFVVLNPAGIQRLTLGVDELHDLARADA